MSTTQSFSLNFVGDVMLGRLVDQLFPEHVQNMQDQEIAASFARKYPSIAGKGNYKNSSPWGTTLPLFQTSDLNIINLETSVTSTEEPWPNKTFNYRMHPANLAPTLNAASIDFANLANNHVLDFGSEGLIETAWTLKRAKIRFAGAGETVDEAFKPAKLFLPRRESRDGSANADADADTDGGTQRDENEYSVHIYCASDHPRDWSVVPNFHFIDYSPSTRMKLRSLLLAGGNTGHPEEDDPESDIYHHTVHHHHDTKSEPPALKIFSVHWGPNYAWNPAEKIRSLAHFLIDECDVDIVHGHSSHHVQGVEVYRGKLILYGCGDFVDDYILHEDFRNDLGAVWRVIVQKENAEGRQGLRPVRLEIFPSQIHKFRAMLLKPEDQNHTWVKRKITALSRDLGTQVRSDLGEEGQIIVDIER